MTDLTDMLLDAALMHVPFDGWSEDSFCAAAGDAGIDLAHARAHLPRGAIDLAIAFHARGDRRLAQVLKDTDLSDLRFRDRVAWAVRRRLELVAADREAVRRGSTLFALPIYAADGAQAIWGTADTIWTALGDTSTDGNWYTKRTILAGVYGATVLYWLGDDSPGSDATWAFLDRRIDNVMQFEKAKASVRKNPILRTLFAGPLWMLDNARAPQPTTDMPGRWNTPQ